MDKVQKIREEVGKKLEVMQYQIHRKDAYKELNCVLDYIDSLQGEPVNNGLEEAAEKNRWGIEEHCSLNDNGTYNYSADDIDDSFKAGYKLHKEQIMAKAIDAELYSDGMFVPLIGFKDKEKVSDIKFGDKVKVIIIKEG